MDSNQPEFPFVINIVYTGLLSFDADVCFILVAETVCQVLVIVLAAVYGIRPLREKAIINLRIHHRVHSDNPNHGAPGNICGFIRARSLHDLV